MRPIIKQPYFHLILTLTVVSVTVGYFLVLPSKNYNCDYQTLSRQCSKCATAKALATADFTKRNYRILRWGLMDIDSPLGKIDAILARNFGIQTVYGGCVPPPALACYDRQMRSLLVKRFGDGFHTAAYQEAHGLR